MELTNFLHAGTNSLKLKGDCKFLGEHVKHGCGKYGNKTLKLTVI